MLHFSPNRSKIGASDNRKAAEILSSLDTLYTRWAKRPPQVETRLCTRLSDNSGACGGRFALGGNMETRTCTKCGKIFPATTEFFHRDKKNKDGICTMCKACRCANSKEWRDANREHLAEYDRRWRAENPELARAANRRWRAANRERRAENSSRWRAANREHLAEYKRLWEAKNPDNRRAARNRRRARKVEAGGNHTTEDIQRQYEVQNGKCWWCQRDVGDDYHADHLVPLAEGGHNGASNLVISCPSCNLSKGAKMPHEFNGRLF